MFKEPSVYFVILNYNSYNDTINCIRSVEKITYCKYKIIVVDNASKDTSVQEISRYFPQHVLIRSGRNLGYANGNNQGISYALKEGADYICILNTDVEVEADFLEKIIKNMIENNYYIAGPCICDYDNRDEVQSIGGSIDLFRGLAQPKRSGQRYDKINKESISVNYLIGACMVIKSEVFNKIGLIPENYFLFFEETEFCLNARRNGFNLICIRDSRIFHKRSATISKFAGLSYYFLNRNRVVFVRRNANVIQRSFFCIYILFEYLGRIIIRKEPWSLYKIFYDGLKTKLDELDINKIRQFIKE